MTAALALDCCERAASRAVRLATVVTCSCGAVLVPPASAGQEERPVFARSGLASLARHPAIRAMTIEPTARGEDHEDPERDARSDSDWHRAYRAQRRLALVRAHSAEGARFADVLWYAFGQRGPEIDKRESVAEQVAKRFVSAAERARFELLLRRSDKGRTARYYESVARIAAGNALLGAAQTAFDRDEWTSWLPEVPDATTARARWVKGVCANWEKAKLALEKRLKPRKTYDASGAVPS